MEIHGLISCYNCKDILSNEGHEITYPDGYTYAVCTACSEVKLW